ncbi:MAG: DegT/DnrJ/EryC1/StrS family aminotransferase [Nitrospirae bacterium]|nr:DegT/DnrJ/EryC1/StrS family aminotransferase [Nitrospirota bacterium]
MNFFNTHISEKSIELVNEVLRSTFISAGKLSDRFERRLEEETGMINPVTVNSGTSALYLALAVAGIKPGDEVILPAQTFIASGLVVLMHYARPVFADIQYKTGNIDPDAIRNKITGKTRAVIPVHWGGYPCDLDEINAIAKQHNLAVIEDAAHALGATYKGRPIGSISRFTAFSFQAIKHLTTGDGGALCCIDGSDHYQAKRRRWFDIDRDNSAVSVLGEREYDAAHVGYKLHMNDLSAAIGIGNLEDLGSDLRRRKEIASLYRRELKDVAGLQLLEYREDRESADWFFQMLVERRIDFIKKLKENNIPASVVHLRIDTNSVFGGTTAGLYEQERFNDKQISIPIHRKLTDDDLYHITRCIKTGW